VAMPRLPAPAVRSRARLLIFVIGTFPSENFLIGGRDFKHAGFQSSTDRADGLAFGFPGLGFRSRFGIVVRDLEHVSADVLDVVLVLRSSRRHDDEIDRLVQVARALLLVEPEAEVLALQPVLRRVVACELELAQAVWRTGELDADRPAEVDQRRAEPVTERALD